MTPEEKAVIEAAIAVRAAYQRNSRVMAGAAASDLIDAVDVLIGFRQAAPVTPEDFTSAPQWVETTMTNALINDRIRIGTEETTVLRSTHGLWHANNRDAWHPTKWQHVELRLELEAVPGLKQYPPAASIDILCTPERLAVLRIQEGFPGSAVTSSHVD